MHIDAFIVYIHVGKERNDIYIYHVIDLTVKTTWHLTLLFMQLATHLQLVFNIPV